jgi:hypothetical protein
MKIGFLSMPLTGHLHPMTALGRKMQARGHEVTFFGLPDAARIVHSAGLDFVPFGEEEYPVGTTPAMYAHLATLKGEDVVRYSFQEMHPKRARITLEQLPEKLVHIGVEALVLDTIHFFAELVPMNMGYSLCAYLECAAYRQFRSHAALLVRLGLRRHARGEGEEHGSRQEDKFCVSTDSAGGTVLGREPRVAN